MLLLLSLKFPKSLEGVCPWDELTPPVLDADVDVPGCKFFYLVGVVFLNYYAFPLLGSLDADFRFYLYGDIDCFGVFFAFDKDETY